MWEPSRLSNGEGRRRLEESLMDTSNFPSRSHRGNQHPTGPTGVVAAACMKEETTSNTGSLGGEGV
jgi:hypothetical protein